MKVEGQIEMEKKKKRKKKHQNNFTKIIQILDHTNYKKKTS